MNSSYHKWLEIEVTHTFYEGGLNRGISLIPYFESSKKLENYNILIQRFENLFSFYVGIKEEDTFSFSEVFEGLGELNFQVIAQAYDFFNFTELPPLKQSSLYYFSNKKPAENNSNLHPVEFVSENDMISWSQKKFNISIEDFEPPLQITNANNEIIRAISQDDNAVSMSIDLSSEEDGIFNIGSNGNIKETFFISDQAPNSGTIGVVNIDLETIAQSTGSDAKYSINFKAREVFRQYLVVVPSSRNMNVITMEIKGKENEIYKGPEETTIVGGETASVFTSNIKMALQEKSKKNAQLLISYTNDFSNGTKDLDLKLPEPGSEQLKIFNTGEHEGSFFSPIIIYV